MAKAFDYVITGGLVFDGLGNAPVREDVAVKNGRIVQRAASIDQNEADEIIDAKGQ